MLCRVAFLASCLLAVSSGEAIAEDSSYVLYRSKMLAAAKRYDEAVDYLREAQTRFPDDIEIKLALARNLSWKGDDKTAAGVLASLDEGNPDTLLLKANLEFHNGHFSKAEALYRKIVRLYPGYQDAEEGLQRAIDAQKAVEQERRQKTDIKRLRAERARNAREQGEREKAERELFVASIPEPQPFAWQVDAGVQISSFSRVPQPNWNQEFLQVTHFLSNRETAIHGKATRYEQFNSVDQEYEFGLDHRFSTSFYGHLYVSGSPDPAFRPEWRVDAGGGYLLMQEKMPLWFTLDARYDSYPTIDVETINPGLRIEPFDNWSLAGRLITVSQQNAATIYGWDVRLDGQIREGTRFYIGYADAPETVAAVTVQTKTFFSGLAYDLSPACTLHFGYAHDDRENSYIRNVFDAGLTYRF